MKSEDAKMFQEIQKNSSMALKAISTISEYVHDASLSRALYGQSRILENIRNRAVDKLLEGGEEVHQNSVVSEMMLNGGIHMNTLMDTSTSHIAEMVIKGNQKGITSMWKMMNHSAAAGKESVELAKELADFEVSCMEQMRGYL